MPFPYIHMMLKMKMIMMRLRLRYPKISRVVWKSAYFRIDISAMKLRWGFPWLGYVVFVYGWEIEKRFPFRSVCTFRYKHNISSYAYSHSVRDKTTASSIGYSFCRFYQIIIFSLWFEFFPFSTLIECLLPFLPPKTYPELTVEMALIICEGNVNLLIREWILFLLTVN